jgi:hypothetical protein
MTEDPLNGRAFMEESPLSLGRQVVVDRTHGVAKEKVGFSLNLGSKTVLSGCCVLKDLSLLPVAVILFLRVKRDITRRFVRFF